MPKTSYADFVTDWEQLVIALSAHAADLTHLEPQRLELETTIGEVRKLHGRMSLLRSELNQTSKDFQARMATGKDLSTRLRAGVKHQFGTRSEELIKYQMKPLRPRQRKPDPEVTVKPADDKPATS